MFVFFIRLNEMKTFYIAFLISIFNYAGFSQTVNQFEANATPTISYRILKNKSASLNHTPGLRFDVGLS
jgi:hypothetical protein